MRDAFGLIWMPAPTSLSAAACSYTWTSKPRAQQRQRRTEAADPAADHADVHTQGTMAPPRPW